MADIPYYLAKPEPDTPPIPANLTSGLTDNGDGTWIGPTGNVYTFYYDPFTGWQRNNEGRAPKDAAGPSPDHLQSKTINGRIYNFNAVTGEYVDTGLTDGKDTADKVQPFQHVTIGNSAYTFDPNTGNYKLAVEGSAAADQTPQIEYDRLNQKEKSDLQTLAYNYMNAGLDANASRQQAYATLIANRNSASVNLAQTSGDIAAQAAKFAANPRDAYSDILYRNAVGGNTPYGSTSGANAAPAQAYQQGLDAKFQELFGGVAGDLSRARGYLDQPLPDEYTKPIQVQMPNMQPTTYAPPPQQAAAPPQQANPAAGMTAEQARAFEAYDNQRRMEQAFSSGQGDQFMQWVNGGHASGGQVKVDNMKQQGADPGKQMMEEHHITKTHPDGKKEVHTIHKSKPWEPKDSAPPQLMDVRHSMRSSQGNIASGGFAGGGGNQMLPEAVSLVGQSGRIYGTAAENGPEMVQNTGRGFHFTPLPGISQHLDPRRQQNIVQNTPSGPYQPMPGYSAGGDMLQAYAAYHPTDQAAQLRGAYAAYNPDNPFVPADRPAIAAPAFTSSSGTSSAGQGDLGPNQYDGQTQQTLAAKPSDAGYDYRYGNSQGTFNTNAGVVPLGYGSIIGGAFGGSGVANPDRTFQGQYSSVVPNTPEWAATHPYNPVGGTHTETRPITDADRQALHQGTANYYIGRSSRPNSENSQWLGNMATFGTNLANHPVKHTLVEYINRNGNISHVDADIARSGRVDPTYTPTGRVVIKWDAQGNPIYGPAGPNGLGLDDPTGGYATDASQWASGQGNAATRHYGGYYGIGNDQQGTYGTGTGANFQGVPAVSRRVPTTGAPPQLGATTTAPAGMIQPPQLMQTNSLASASAPAPDALTQQIIARLKAIDPQAVPQPGQALPDLRLFSADVINALEQDSDLMELVQAAYSKRGISPQQFMDTIKRYRFSGPSNFQPTVRW